MEPLLSYLVALFTAAGIGGIVGAYFQAKFQERTRIGQQAHDLKQRRYLCILILMLTKLNPSVGLPKLPSIRPDLRSATDVEDELRTELLNAVVFASDHVLKALASFIRTPDHKTFAGVATAMRADLWGVRGKVTDDLFDVVGSALNQQSVAPLEPQQFPARS